jgi:hypothetical protein
MNKKLVLTALGLMMLATFIGIAKAQINVTLTLTDESNNSIGGTVPAGTIVHVTGFYSNQGSPADGLMEVYYNNGQTKETLYSGSVNSGQTITKTYTLTEEGSYEFRWTCTVEVTLSASGGPSFGAQCIIKRGFVTVHIVTLPVPEPGTLAGLIMALSAFGLLAIKKAKR